MFTSQPSTVLLIDDDGDMRWAMRTILAGAGFAVAEAEAGRAGLEAVRRQAPDAVLLDMQMPHLSGEEVLRHLRGLDPYLPVIVVTAYGSVAGAVRAVRSGAFDYIAKPFRNEHLVQSVRRAIARRLALRAPGDGVSAAIKETMGRGPAIQKLIAQIEPVVASNYSVVIQGETGTGKELVARALHQHGPRAAHPLIVVDCGTVVDTLADSEFFGHEKGAFTGATERRIGCFEAAAKGGTIFLDEIGNLAAAGQKALLRTLEQHTIRRLGGTESIHLDFRVIAATNDDLMARVRAGSFREDLYFRLAEYVITVPALRTRPEDIEFLADRFLAEARLSLGRLPLELTASTLDALRAHNWPGNVRELRNIVRRAALPQTDVLNLDDLLAGYFEGEPTPAATSQPAATGGSLRHRVQDQIRVVERDAVISALEEAGGNKAKAARLLGIDYKTYRTKLKLLKDVPGKPANGHT